ncbi:MAG: leucine-rich repeat protein [Clostridia bacterium]
MCICMQPLAVNAYRPSVKRQVGDYIYRQYDLNFIQGYVGTDEDIVIPILKDGFITIESLGDNKYVKSITLNEKVWNVQSNALDGCINLENIFIDPDNEHLSSIDGVLFDKEGTTLLIYPPGRTQTEYHVPEGTFYVSSEAFRVERSFLDFRGYLKRIYLPESIKEFMVNEYSALDTQKAVYVDSKNERYMSINGMLIERKTGELVLYPGAKTKRFISPDEVKSIGENVFKQKGIRYAGFNDDLLKIGAKAFLGCKLRKVDIPDNVSLIEAHAFDNNKIRILKLGDSIRIIDTGAFSRNEIRKLRIGSGVEVIGAIAFKDNRITSLKLNDSLKWINGGAFADNRITRLKLNDSLEYIGEYAFSGNNIRGELILPASLEYIGEYAFTSEKISKVVISDGVLIEGNLFGSDKFKIAYDEHGAGEYVRTDEGEWIKQ